MCGRFSSLDEENGKEITKFVHEAEALFQKAETPYKLKTKGEVFPTDVVPVISRDPDASGGKARLCGRAMYWGFPGFPDRSRPNAKPKPLINTKSETALELRTWKDSVSHRRCVIPSSGFYEWSHDKAKSKTKYLFTVPHSRGLLLGGIYKEFKDADGAPFPHFSIITTAANGSMREIHNRMPLVLKEEEFPAWFSDGPEFEGLLPRNDIELAKKPV
jgi:putative SOS response-associated peptidase YedK